MNKEWSDKNKQIQILLGKETTYRDGIELLIKLREELFEQVTQIVKGYPDEAFYQMPFAKAKGYHSKTLSYSIWHIFRIEDIVAHTLIAGDEQIFMAGDYQKKIGSPIITNALVAPTINYGVNLPCDVHLAGTTSIKPET